MKSLKALTLGLFAVALPGCGDFSMNPFEADVPLRVPEISVQTPATAQAAADESFEIRVSFSSVTVVDTWDLFYISEATQNKGYPIGTNFPVTARTIAWDTQEMPAGVYYIYAELKSLDSTVTATAPGSIRIDHPGTGNTSPTISLSTLTGGQTVTPGETVAITWSASDGDGDSMTFTVELSADDGYTWTELTTGGTATTYSWAVPADQAPGMTYRVRVTAEDADGATASDSSDVGFSILP